MTIWDSLSAGAKKAGDATKLAAKKTKLRTDMAMIDREIQNRKKAFGVTMYDHVSPLSQTSDFYAATDELTNILRPPLINAQKEIQAYEAKMIKLKEKLAAKEEKRAGAFPTKAETVGQKTLNFGKASIMHSKETKIKAELKVVERQIKGEKQKFGLELFPVLVEAEDTRAYLPSDRQVRSIYDTARGDIDRLKEKKKEKAEKLAELGGGKAASEQPGDDTEANDLGMFEDPDSTNNPSGGSSSTTAPAGYTDAAPTTNNQQMQDLLL